jgi:FdhD protein
MDNIEKFSVERITREGKTSTQAMVIKELPLTIILNDRELVTLLCSPVDLKYLAIGFLFSEGLVKTKGEIERILVDQKRGVVRVKTTNTAGSETELVFKRLITSGCGRGASFYSAADTDSRKVDSPMKIALQAVFGLAHKFQHSSQAYLATHGAHSCALCDTKDILVFSEDIGRHNAVDKIFGECLLKDIPTKDRVIVTSGRVSSEILHKVARREVPVLISISVPTSLGVRLANDLGITLIGFVRGGRMNIYTHGWRVVAGD